MLELAEGGWLGIQPSMPTIALMLREQTILALLVTILGWWSPF